MAIFTVRVELHEAEDADYQRLNAAMELAGYRRQVASDDGVVFLLPNGEFDLVANGNVSQVMEHAYKVATGVKRSPDPSILVTQASFRAWNLPKAARRAP